MSKIKFRVILIVLLMILLGATGTHAGTGAAVSNIITVDTTDPTGTVTINGAAVYTTNSAVILTLSASDPGVVTEMKFSNDNITWSAAETYGTTKTWTLSSGNDIKTVYAKFKDTAGNWSSVYSDTIVLDTAVPTTTPSAVGGTYDTIKTVTLSANETSTIYYTTDGTDPTKSGTRVQYTGTSISINATTTLKYYAVDTAGNASAVQTQTYVIMYNLTVTPSGTGTGSVSSNPSGITCGSDCAESYSPNTQVTLTATPSAGSLFTGWSGACTGTGACIVTMSSNKAVTATFFKTINLPRTGQAKCYDAAGAEMTCSGTGQDGEIQAGVAWPNPRFTAGTGAEAECMIDNLTGLMWPKNGNLPNASDIWNRAVDYTKAVTLCGHSDWRLPNINELESLANIGEPNPAAWLDTQGFNDVQWGYHWSSTTYAGNTDGAWTMHMWRSYVTGDVKTNGEQILPVRGGQPGSFGNSVIWRTGQIASYRAGDDGDLKQGVSWPFPRFTDEGNGKVTDNLTGLLWTKDANAPGPSACSPTSTKTWQGALDYVKCLNTQNYLGHNDWRLPNRKELRSISDCSLYNPALLSGYGFTNVQSNYYWSSTTYALSTGSAWSVNMWGGYSNEPDYKTNSNYVWPVRGGQLSSSVGLTVSKLGTGSGTVTSDPAGINCGSTCSTIFTPGTSVALTATPSAGSTFTGWSGGGCSGTNTTCTITVDTAKTVTATFDDTTAPIGTVGISGGAQYVGNGTVTLTLSSPDAVQMQFSNDNTTWSTAETYSTTKTWLLPSGDGAKTVYVKFKDNANNWSTPYTVTTSLDTTKPTLTLSTLSNNSYTANPTLNISGTVTDNIKLKALTINDASVNVNTDGSFSSSLSLSPGANTITTVAMDMAGNKTTDTRVINLDRAAPELTITSPADNSKTKQTSINVTGTISEYATLEIKVNNEATQSIPTEGGSFSIPVTLAYGTNTIELKATDRAGNASSAKRTVTFDNQGPSLSITEPSQDISTKQNSITLKGEISDLTTPTVIVTKDGEIFTPSVTAGKFEQPLTFTTEKTYAVTIKATDELGNETTVQRNIIYDTTSPDIIIHDPSYRKFVLEAASWTAEKKLVSDKITIRVVDDYGQPANVTSDTLITVGSSSATGRFTINEGMSFSSKNTATLTIFSGYNFTEIQYMDTGAGIFDITASGKAATPSASWQPTSHAMTVTSATLKDAGLTVSVAQNAIYGQIVTVTGMLKDALTSGAIPYETVYVKFTSPTGTQSPEYVETTTSDGAYTSIVDTSTVDTAGNWTVTATFKGNQAYNVKSASAGFTVSKVNTSVTVSLDRENTSLSGLVKVSGKLNADTLVPVNLKGITLDIHFTEPDGTTGHTINAVTYDSFGHFEATFNQFASLGNWDVSVTYGGNTNFNGSESISKDITVATTAGYAILIEGEITGSQNRASYTLSLDDIYDKLIRRSFKADDIYYLSYETSHTRVDEVTTKQNIERAITTSIYDRIAAGGVAPLYIVMVDHGEKGKFHIAPDVITPEELSGWIATLEEKVQTILGKKLTTIIINGSCYAGSFITKLSKQGRAIITSSGENEQSVQGPDFGDKVYGEYFIYYLFNNLANGDNLRDAFKDAASQAHKITECKLEEKNCPKSGESARQRPLLDDNGDGIGSWMNVVGKEDGGITSNLKLGLGTNAVALRWNEVMATTRVMLSGSAPVAYAQTTNAARTSSSWVEIRKPSYRLPETTGTGQIIMKLPKIAGSYNEQQGKWEYILSGLDEPGTYSLYYYAMDTDGDIIPPAMGTLYVDKQTNQMPSAPVPVSPSNNEEVTDAMMVFGWSRATDPDGDPLTYTVKIYEDTNGSKGREIKRYELVKQEGYYINATKEKQNDGTTPLFTTGRYYWWDVEAIDNKGAYSTSISSRFHIAFTNAVNGIITGIIYSNMDYSRIVGAAITSTGGTSSSSLTNGTFMITVPPGVYTLSVTSSGYQSASTSQVSVSAGEATVADIKLSSSNPQGWYSLVLSAGWNFVSIPVLPEDTTITTVLANVISDLRVVWGYDNGQKQWLKYSLSTQNPTLNKFESGKGYWIYMNNPATLTVNGKDVSPTVTLSNGWNLVGYGGQDNTMNLPANYVIIWGWENGTWKAKAADTSLELHVSPLDALNRGKACWIKMNTAQPVDWAQ